MSRQSHLSTIDVLILCGGLGKRLREKIGESQKVMAAVGKEPFLNFILRDLAHQGCRRVVLCTGYKKETIEEYYQEKKFGLTIAFSREARPLGTGGAIKNARPFIRSHYFLAMNGDSYCRIDLEKFFAFHKAKKALVSIAAAKTDDRKDFGSIAIDGTRKVTAFREKIEDSASSYVNAGIYCFRRDAF